MKFKKSLLFILSSTLILGAISLSSCTQNKPEEQDPTPGPGDDDKPTPQPEDEGGKEKEDETPALVVLTGAKNGYVGESFLLTAQIFNSDKTEIEWVSSNPAVLTVNESGLVTLVGSGSATVTAKLSGTKYTSSPVTITVFGSESALKRLEIVSYPNQIGYKKGDKLSFNGLKVSGFTYFGGVKNPNTGVDFDLSELNFSLSEGTELNEIGQKEVVISASGYESVKFVVEVNNKLIEKVATITTLPQTAYYLDKGEATTNFSKIKVAVITYEDGVKKATKSIGESEYTLSMISGEKVYSEGSYEVTVKPNDETVRPVNFTIQVYTKDLTLRNLVSKLAKAKNYQYEVLNNVGTTRDTTGFHYLRTVTENYYDEIEYQNYSDGSNIVMDDSMLKSHVGYTAYTDEELFRVVLSFKRSETKKDKNGKETVVVTESSLDLEKDAIEDSSVIYGTWKDLDGNSLVISENGNATFTEKVGAVSSSYDISFNEETGEIVDFASIDGKIVFTEAQFIHEHKTGIMEYKEDSLGDIICNSIVTEGPRSWRDMSSTLARTFASFTVKEIPDYTYNGKYLSVNLEAVEGDDDDGTQTQEKYPLITEFLGFCGWSKNLVTIMSRFTMEVTGENSLSMKAYFGNYGTTEMKVNAVGNAKNNKVERALRSGLSVDKSVKDELVTLRDALYLNNYTVYNYSTESDHVSYQTENYYYDIEGANGYAKVNGTIYSFTGTEADGFTLGSQINTKLSLPQYVNSISETGKGYVGEYMKSVLGEGENLGKLYTIGEYSGFSSGKVICYQSFDDKILNTFSMFNTGKKADDGLRFWCMARYDDIHNKTDANGINNFEIWAIDINTYRGYVYAMTDVGRTKVQWIEDAINELEA